MPQSRQLAAILFSDIVGYTTMMGENENATLKLVRKSREIQKPLVEKYHGTWLKEMGDGAMAQFNSALDAVSCAVEIQQIASTSLNAKLRIGIHLGDITVDNDEVYGDGVNVASRIESVAEPDSIFISEAVQGAIKGSDIHTAFRGEKKLRNVDHPVRVYQVVDEAEPISRALVQRKSHLPWLVGLALVMAFAVWKFTEQTATIQSKTIAVLPFKMNDVDSANQYLVEGITEEMVRSIGKLRNLTVVNTYSAMKFVASVSPVQEAKSQMPATDYFLTGSFSTENNTISLNLSLQDSQQAEVWTNNYQDDISRIPELTGKIAVELAKVIKIKLEQSEVKRITEIPAVDPELLELLFRGKSHLFKFTPEDIAIGVNYIKQAKDKNPASTRAWSMWAECMVYMGHSPSPLPGVWQEAKASAIRAIQLDSTNAEAWGALAHVKTYFEWDYDGAVYCYHMANALNPNMAVNHYHYSWHLWLFDSLDKAIEEHKIAQSLDPLDPGHSAFLAWLYVEAGDLEQARKEADRALRIEDNPIGYINLGRVYMAKEQYDSAELAFNKAGPWAKHYLGINYFRSGQIDKGLEIIRELESRPINSYLAYSLINLYAEIDSVDKYFHYANYEPASAFMPWARHDRNPKIIADPRFKELMDKMNLPMPTLPQ